MRIKTDKPPFPNILKDWGFETNRDSFMGGSSTDNEFHYPIKMPQYTLSIDLELPFGDDRIGVVIINGIEYVRKTK